MPKKEVRGMPRKRQPTDLVLLKGKAHLTKAQIDERKEKELAVPPGCPDPPAHLNGKRRDEFIKLAELLMDSAVLTRLDGDILAAYIETREEWIRLGEVVDGVLALNPPDLEALSKAYTQRDKATKQLRALAGELGLTIASRCKLAVPKKEEPPPNKFARFASG